MSIAEMAAATALPRQTVGRLVHTLAGLACLEQRQSDRRFQPGPRLLGVGRALLASLPICEIARPFMQQVADVHSTSVALGVAHELDMIYIAYCTSAQTVTFWLRLGSAIPMATTALGRAYLWGLKEAHRAPLLDRIMTEAGPQAKALSAAISQSFRELDKRGYCSTFPSSRGDICGVGVPLIFNDADTVLALNCGAARLGLDERRFRDDCGPALLQAVASIKNAAGAIEPERLGVAHSLGG